MKVKGYGAWPSRNVSSGGQKSSFDEYNRALKGSERRPKTKEYYSSGTEEYHHYSEIQDLTKEDQNKDEKQRSKKDDKSRSSRIRIVQQVAVLAVGSVMVMNSYNAQVAKRVENQASDPGASASDVADDNTGYDNGFDGGQDADDMTSPSEGETTPSEAETKATEAPTAPTEAETRAGETASQQGSSGSSQSSSSGAGTSSSGSSQSGSSSSGTYTVSWSWSSGNTEAVLVFKDSSGRTVSESTATVTTSYEAAGCKTVGKTVHTATAQANGRTYTDTRTEETPALGHAFGSGKETTLADGRTAMDFECTRCHEHFTIVNSIDEE